MKREVQVQKISKTGFISLKLHGNVGKHKKQKGEESFNMKQAPQQQHPTPAPSISRA